MFADMMRLGDDAAERGLGDGRLWENHPMMWWGGSGGSSFFWFHAILALITWVLVIIVLIALARWLWKKGDKVR